jgi:hypothetical protein
VRVGISLLTHVYVRVSILLLTHLYVRFGTHI